jgi:hypothetical protein
MPQAAQRTQAAPVLAATNSLRSTDSLPGAVSDFADPFAARSRAAQDALCQTALGINTSVLTEHSSP